MLLKFAIKNLAAKRRTTLVSFSGIMISVGLIISIILVLKAAQKSFAKPLEDSGADMIVQLQGEPCVWSVVKLPTNLNPLPLDTVDKIKSMDEVSAAEGSLITWAFSNAPPQFESQYQNPSGNGMNPDEIMAGIQSGQLEGEPCDYGPEGSFCGSGDAASISADFKPVVVVGVNQDPGNIGPIKSSDLEHIQGRFFSKEDNGAYVTLLDKDFARTRNLKIGDGVDLGQRFFKVIGIVDPGRDAKIAGAQAFISLKTAIDMTGRGDIVDIVFVKLKGDANPDNVKKKIQAIVSKDATITTSSDYLPTIAGFSNLTQKLGLAIFFIVILIAVLYIAKTAFGSVLERSKEIGILKGIGWRDRDIIKVIAIEHFIIGLLGGIAGSILGYITSFLYKTNISSFLPYYLNPYPPCSQYLVKNSIQVVIPFSINIFVTVMLTAITIVTLSGFIASKSILKLSPADATRKI
ncbi:MAG: ABC transporter permease [Candidatus Omnitrophota bacterium]